MTQLLLFLRTNYFKAGQAGGCPAGQARGCPDGQDEGCPAGQVVAVPLRRSVSAPWSHQQPLATEPSLTNSAEQQMWRCDKS